MKRIGKLSLVAMLALTAGQSHGQTPEAKADLALLETRAAADADMAAIWSQLRAQVGAGTDHNVTQLLDMFSGIRQNRASSLPLNYRVRAQVQAANIRAQNVAAILRSDLNGDWQVSREELVASLGQTNRDGGEAATAFVLGDADQDGTLSTDEIKAAIEAMLGTASRQHGLPNGQRLFDLDDDGILTQSEYDRVLAALKS